MRDSLERHGIHPPHLHLLHRDQVKDDVEYAIETVDLTKKFGKHTAVDHLDLKVRRGQLYALLGPNGSGKSTLIKMIVGILRPTEGEIHILDCKMPDKGAMHEVGYMPQETALYKDLTVSENIHFLGEIYGVSKEDIRRREMEILKFVDLEEWKREVVTHLSAGMKHRTSLACSLISNPRLLILDEPTVGVDPELRRRFWDYFERLRSAGITILITTHYMDEARHCETVGFLREGRLILEGKPADILQQTCTDNLEDAFLVTTRGHCDEADSGPDHWEVKQL